MSTLVIGMIMALALSLIVGLLIGIFLWSKENKALEAENKEKQRAYDELRRYYEDLLTQFEELRMRKKGMETEKEEDITRLRNKKFALLEKIEYKEKSEASLQRKVAVLQDENRYLIEYGPKILRISKPRATLDKLMDGTEKVVLQSTKDYWKKQLLDSEGAIKEFHVAIITNGHRSGYEEAQFIINHIEISRKEKSDDKKEYFHIHLGERLN